MRADFCVKFTQLSNNKYITSPKGFVEIYSKMTHQPRKPSFLSVQSDVFTGSLLVDLKRACLLRDGQTSTADVQSSQRWQPQLCRQISATWNSPPRCWCVLVTALPGALRGDFQLMLPVEFILVYQHGSPYMIVTAVGSNL